MRIAVIGGSSQSTPNLFAYFGRVAQSLPAGLEVVLFGRSEHRLGAVQRASRLLLEGADIKLDAKRIEPRTLAAALNGADLVLVQARIGGYQGRIFDESLLGSHGLPGDQEIGPGGLAAAWRSWPELERLLNAVKKASPLATVIILSSPVTLLVRASRLRFPELQTLGICEVPRVTLARIASATGVPAEAVKFRYHGVSHFGWFYDIEAAGHDLAREYLETGAGREQRDEWWAHIPAVATRFVKLQYRGASPGLAHEGNGRSRGRVLRAIRNRAMRAFTHGTQGEIREVLRLRPAAWYEQAIGPLLLALAGVPAIEPMVFLSVPNRGAYEHLRDSDVLELPHRVRSGTLDRLPTAGHIPPPVRTEVGRHVDFQREATNAFMSRSVAGLQIAFESHPWVRSRACACAMATVIGTGFPP